MALICVRCGAQLERSPLSLVCRDCGAEYPAGDGIADFSSGSYYDVFAAGDPVPPGLEPEIAGAGTRARFYEPLIAGATRVLDCGCGNGLTVEHLRSAGFDAWGTDVSAFRKWQWRERAVRDHLVVTDGKRLPFADGYFDAIISSGVLEHIGVVEEALPAYRVRPLRNRDDDRIAFLQELLRVLAPHGALYLDFPNGAFPVDFWHGPPRVHSPFEGFLPAMHDLRRLFAAMPVKVTAISPYGRLEFRQHGRVFAPLGRAFFAAMKLPLLRLLAGSPLNPFLVVKVVRSAREPLPR